MWTDNPLIDGLIKFNLLNFNTLPLNIPIFWYFQSSTVFWVCCSCLPLWISWLVLCLFVFWPGSDLLSGWIWTLHCHCVITKVLEIYALHKEKEVKEKGKQIYGLLTVCRFMPKQKIYMNRSSSVETKHWIFSLLFLLHCFYYYCIKGPLITATTNVLIKVPLLSYIVVTSSWPLSLYHLSIWGPWKLTLGSRWRKALFVCLRSDLLLSTLLFFLLLIQCHMMINNRLLFWDALVFLIPPVLLTPSASYVMYWWIDLLTGDNMNLNRPEGKG